MQGQGRRSNPHVPPTSDELIGTYRRSGRPDDFEHIVRRFAALVLSECRRITANVHDAEDASQLVFLALAMEIKSSARSIRLLSSWLRRVARRQALKIVRTRSRQRRRDDAARRPELQLPTNGDIRLDIADTAGIVRDAIDELPEKYRLAVILHYFGGMNLERVAAELRLKRPAVATRLHRGRKMLAARLAQRGLKLENNTLAAALAVLVPTSVIHGIVSSAGAMTMPAEVAAALPHVIGRTLRAVAVAGLRRPLCLAAVAVALACGGSGLAWVVGGRSLDLRRVREIDLQQWWQTILPELQPRPQIRAAAPVQVTPLPPPLQPGLSSAFAAQPPPSQIPFSPPSAPAIPSHLPPVARHTDQVDVGVGGAARLAIDGQKHLAVSQLRLGVDAVSVGTIIQRDDGVVSVDHLIIGDAGFGTYDLIGGTLDVGSLTIAAQPGSIGQLNIAGGEVLLTRAGGSVVVGGGGAGTLLVGTPTAPGMLRATGAGIGAPFIIGQTSGARGVVQGWGAVGTGGLLINNGQVIGDGYNHTRALDLRDFTGVGNTIDNPRGAGGDKGWYVQRGGQVRLPDIHVQPGTHTYTWGESPDRPLDLVNSLRLCVHDQPAPATMSIALRTIALADPLDITLPSEISVIGLWQFDSDDSFDPSQLDVLVRYNDVAANTFFPGESALQMLAFDGDEWHVGGNLSHDVLNNYISAEFGGAFDYLIVAVPWNVERFAPAGLHAAPPNVAASPEPSMVLGVLVVLFLPRRRRRRRSESL